MSDHIPTRELPIGPRLGRIRWARESEHPAIGRRTVIQESQAMRLTESYRRTRIDCGEAEHDEADWTYPPIEDVFAAHIAECNDRMATSAAIALAKIIAKKRRAVEEEYAVAFALSQYQPSMAEIGAALGINSRLAWWHVRRYLTRAGWPEYSIRAVLEQRRP